MQNSLQYNTRRTNKYFSNALIDVQMFYYGSRTERNTFTYDSSGKKLYYTTGERLMSSTQRYLLSYEMHPGGCSEIYYSEISHILRSRLL